MKFLIGAAAALLVAGAAFAQDTTQPAPAATPTVAANSQCAAVGPEPTLPDAATATPQTIQAGNAAYQAWGSTAQDSIHCRHAEIEQLQARLQALTEEHNAIVRRVNTLTQTWGATATAYCARSGVHCQSQQAQPQHH